MVITDVIHCLDTVVWEIFASNNFRTTNFHAKIFSYKGQRTNNSEYEKKNRSRNFSTHKNQSRSRTVTIYELESVNSSPAEDQAQSKL